MPPLPQVIAALTRRQPDGRTPSRIGWAALVWLFVNPPSAARAVYYASPTGGGNGRREATPFRIADFWPVGKRGDVLLLCDGVYRGAASIITPPRGPKGERGKPITIRALHDGRVEIDGENARRPCCTGTTGSFSKASTRTVPTEAATTLQ